MNIRDSSRRVTFEKILPLIGKVVYPLLLKEPLFSLYAPKDEFEVFQLQRLKEVAHLAYQTPFYKKKFDESKVDVNEINDVEDLKIRTSRKDVEKYKNEMRRRNCKVYFSAHTSGSTGNPLYVDVSPQQFVGMFPQSERYLKIIGVSRKSKILTLFPREAPSYVAAALALSLLNYPFKVADFFKLEDQIRKVRDRNVIIGYATKVLNLIQNCKEKDVENLEAIIYSAEPLPKSAKEYIEEKTPAKVHGIYASIEALAPIGIMCKKDNYHLNPDLFWMELDDEKSILLTFLDPKRATILLRYEIGDKGSWKNCNCGITFPAFDLEGKFRHLTSQRIEAAMYSSRAFREGLISPYFEVEEKLDGAKRVFIIYLERKNGNAMEIAEEIKNIIIHGNKRDLLPSKPLEIMVEGGTVDLQIKFAEDLSRLVKNPRFW